MHPEPWLAPGSWPKQGRRSADLPGQARGSQANPPGYASCARTAGAGGGLLASSPLGVAQQGGLGDQNSLRSGCKGLIRPWPPELSWFISDSGYFWSVAYWGCGCSARFRSSLQSLVPVPPLLAEPGRCHRCQMKQAFHAVAEPLLVLS